MEGKSPKAKVRRLDRQKAADSQSAHTTHARNSPRCGSAKGGTGGTGRVAAVVGGEREPAPTTVEETKREDMHEDASKSSRRENAKRKLLKEIDTSETDAAEALTLMTEGLRPITAAGVDSCKGVEPPLAKPLLKEEEQQVDSRIVTKQTNSTSGTPHQKDGQKRALKRQEATSEQDNLDSSEVEECSIISVESHSLKMDSQLEALETVQMELGTLNERAASAILRMNMKFNQLRKPYLEKRNTIIQNIPGFWVTAFLNHPQLSALIDEKDEDTLSYMTNLEVADLKNKPGYRIKFYFGENPYFQNEIITKEFHIGSLGRLVSASTPIRWWRGLDPAGRNRVGGRMGRSFFSWFTDHSTPSTDRIAQIIKEDLWPNPLQYYLITECDSGENGQEDSDLENGDDCVVIVDDEGDEDDEVQEITDEEDGNDGGEEGVEDDISIDDDDDDDDDGDDDDDDGDDDVEEIVCEDSGLDGEEFLQVVDDDTNQNTSKGEEDGDG
ncbi:protein SET-like [Protopterus annectens]|uniref:protein SET-like n=1 Tax=Protopterus annectens TaxID=7888 RepID=UPI001CF99276|nr:protein SET-like [Protopterus annectens]